MLLAIRRFILPEIGLRIRKYRESKGLNAIQLANIIGVSSGTLSDIESGNTQPSADTLASIVRNTEISAKWLLTGQGEMDSDAATHRGERVARDDKTAAYAAASPETKALIDQVLEIMNSKDQEAKDNLAISIRHFIQVVKKQKKIDKLEKVLREIRKKNRPADPPGDVKAG